MRLMAHYRDTRALEGSSSEQFGAACAAMTGSVVPYIAACFTRVYPGQGSIDVRKATAALNAPPPSPVEDDLQQPSLSSTPTSAAV